MTQVLQFPVPPKKEETKYLGLAASNKLIRQVLKAQFPGVKFSVKGDSYAGGSSTNVSWTDGPTEAQVDALIGGYASAGFDGSIDLQYSYDQWLLPNGLIVTAGTSGTAGSMGYVSAFTHGAAGRRGAGAERHQLSAHTAERSRPSSSPVSARRYSGSTARTCARCSSGAALGERLRPGRQKPRG